MTDTPVADEPVKTDEDIISADADAENAPVDEPKTEEVKPAKKVVKKKAETEEVKVVGGDGLVDGETTHGEDIKGASTF